jgi:mRNA interferase RelE/StbE
MKTTEWRIRIQKDAQKELSKLDRPVQKRIIEFLEHKLGQLPDPKIIGKPLTDNLLSFWRYRVGNYRIICEIKDHELIILVVRIAHRKDVYKD